MLLKEKEKHMGAWMDIYRGFIAYKNTNSIHQGNDVIMCK